MSTGYPLCFSDVVILAQASPSSARGILLLLLRAFLGCDLAPHDNTSSAQKSARCSRKASKAWDEGEKLGGGGGEDLESGQGEQLSGGAATVRQSTLLQNTLIGLTTLKSALNGEQGEQVHGEQVQQRLQGDARSKADAMQSEVEGHNPVGAA